MSGLFGRPSNSIQTEVYAGVQVSTSQYGQPIPYVAGRQRIPFTLLWYGNFQANGSSDSGKGGGGSGTKTYTYTTAYQAALCLAPIVGVFQIWHDKALETLTTENLALSLGGAAFTGSISGTTLSASNVIGLIQIGAALTCAAVTPGTTITGFGTGSGGNGTYTVSASQAVSAQVMSSSQLTWTGYPSGTPTGQMIPYDHMAQVSTNSYNLGSSAAMPNLTFEVEGSIPGFSDAHGMYDADPSATIVQYLTDPVIGAGFQGQIQPLTGSTNTFQAYVMSLGLLTSPYENTQRAATDFIKELLQICNSEMFVSVGYMKIMPLADQPVSGTTPDGSSWSYTPNLTPVFAFTDDHYLPQKGDPPVKVTRRALNDTHNMVNLEYVDRLNYYNTAPVNASLNSDIALTGPRLMSELTFHQITNSQTALMAAQLILQADRYELNTLEFRVPQDFMEVEPLDYISVTDSGLGYNDQVCRVLEVSDDAEGVLTIKALEMPGVVRTSAQYNWGAAAGYAANYATAPGSVQAPAIFLMPPVPAAQLSGGLTLGIVAAPTASQLYWLGCHVWMSVDGGNTYILAGLLPGAGRYGTITSNMTAVADPDTTNTLSVSLNDTNLQISTATTHADADSNQTLIIVGSGSTAEVMSFGAASLVSAGNYNLSYFRRNLYGSSNHAHSSGAQFVRLDGAVLQVPLDPGYGGQTLYFKLTSFNTWQQAEEELSAVTAYTYTIPAGAPTGAVQLTPRGNAIFVEGNAYKIVGSASGWDSDCVTPQSYDALSAFCLYSAGSDLAFGLSPNVGATLNPSNTSGAGTFDFCFNVIAGVWKIFERGVLQTTLSTAVANDSARITYDQFTVRYYLNGALVRQIPGDGTQEYVGFTMFEAADEWGGILVSANTVASPQQFIGRGLTSVSDTNVSKTTNDSLWTSGDAISIDGYTNCHVIFKANQTSAAFAVALVTGAPPQSPSFTALTYAFCCTSGTALQVYQGGTLIGTFGTYSTSDLLAITYDGATVSYIQNGNVLTTASVSGTPTMYAVVNFNNAGGLNSLEFGPTSVIGVTSTGQLDIGAATDVTAVFTAGPTTYTMNSSGIISVTPGYLPTITLPQPVDDNYLVIVTVYCEVISSAVPFGSTTGFSVQVTQSGGATGGTSPVYNGNGSARTPFTIQFQQAVLDTTAITVTFIANLGLSSSVEFYNVQMQAELVKR